MPSGSILSKKYVQKGKMSTLNVCKTSSIVVPFTFPFAYFFLHRNSKNSISTSIKAKTEKLEESKRERNVWVRITKVKIKNIVQLLLVNVAKVEEMKESENVEKFNEKIEKRKRK